MKTSVPCLLLLATLAAPAVAQTKAPAKPAAKSSAPAAKPTAKPAAKAPARTTAKPATRPAAAPAAKPAPAPAAAPAPAPTAATEPLIPAQGAVSFTKGTTAVNLGIGFGIGYGYGFGFGGQTSSTPALSLSVEKGIIDNIGPGVLSVGGLIGYKGYHWDWDGIGGDTYKASWHNFIAVARGAYHYNFTTDPKLDTYAGLSLGMRFLSYSDNYDNVFDTSYKSRPYVTSGLFVGGRYMLSNNLGGFAEVGYDMSYLKVGLTAKF